MFHGFEITFVFELPCSVLGLRQTFFLQIPGGKKKNLK